MREEMDVGAGRGPVPQRREVHDGGAHGHGQPAAEAQPAQHFGRGRIGGHNDVRPVSPDQVQDAGRTEPGQSRLREAPRRREPGEDPEPDVPEPVEPVEEDTRCALADGDDRPTHRREPVLGRDLDVGLLLA